MRCSDERAHCIYNILVIPETSEDMGKESVTSESNAGLGSGRLGPVCLGGYINDTLCNMNVGPTTMIAASYICMRELPASFQPRAVDETRLSAC